MSVIQKLNSLHIRIPRGIQTHDPNVQATASFTTTAAATIINTTGFFRNFAVLRINERSMHIYSKF
jgi:hypothetical protein